MSYSYLNLLGPVQGSIENTVTRMAKKVQRCKVEAQTRNTEYNLKELIKESES
jgi:hypothetical protein